MNRKKTRRWAKIIAVALAGVLFVANAGAEEAAIDSMPARDTSNGFALGFGLNDAAGDFGSHVGITTPWILWDHAAARVSGAVLFRERTWKPYFAVRAGLVGGSFMASADIRIYGEGGGLFVFPSDTVDSDSFVFGGYGHFGVEFFMDRAHSGLATYIELGSNGIGATADKEAGSPVYLNGFMTSVGLRWYP